MLRASSCFVRVHYASNVHIEGCCLGSHVGPGFNPEVMPYVRGGAGGGGSGMVRVYAMCIAKMSALDFKSLQ